MSFKEKMTSDGNVNVFCLRRKHSARFYGSIVRLLREKTFYIRILAFKYMVKSGVYIGPKVVSI